MKKVISFLLIILIFCLVLGGCQNKASKKIVEPDKKNLNNQASISDSEQRVMAGRLSNLANEVPGVERASVILTNVNLKDMDFVKKSNKKDKKPSNPSGSLIIVAGININDDIKSNEKKLNDTKEKIIKKFQSEGLNLAEIYITFEPEIIGMIDDIVVANLQGESVEGHRNKIETIIDKIEK